MLVQPYLFFNGRCEEALTFYREKLGAEVSMMMRFSESPEPCDPNMVPPGSEHKIMHASFRIGESTIMASDGNCADQTQPEFKGFSLTIEVPDAAKADQLFAALGDGGQVQMPMTQTFFSPRFGVLADRFGMSWMILVAQP